MPALTRKSKPLKDRTGVNSAKKSICEVSGIENLIRAMLKRHHTPFMIIKRHALEKQYKRFQKCLPEVTPYYAIKANPYSRIIKTFIKLGAGFDVASGAEMKQVLRLGVSPSKIIFANTIKTGSDITLARRRRVRLMTFDNEPELYKIAKHYPKAHVLVRIKVENQGSVV
ncbi:MAG: hypothetical protein U9R52_02420, partial [Candidatus Omnitrophota bacterium]|nr:hypothetical protein [Candidatus Omnitrophota bacterium]